MTDALGSTIALIDPSGNTQAQYGYDPYGNMNATGSTTNSYTYTGREFDGLGLYYYRARYYNPNTGRFLSEDPIGFLGGINEYAYAGDDPIDYFDPFGLDKNPPSNFTKHFGLTTPCGSSSSQVMGAVESNFAQFGNYSRWGGAESVTFSPPAGMGPGSTIPINVGILGFNQSLSVTVQSMNSQSMTFTTNPGHLANLAYSYDLDGRRTAVSGSLAASQLPAAVSSAAYNPDNQLVR
jgi:RHS repeat-associated protein